jgi:glutathionyl-hydroquinone reductase
VTNLHSTLPNTTSWHLLQFDYLFEIYYKAKPDYCGRYSNPILWDKRRNQIFNNESEDIMRMLDVGVNRFIPQASPERFLHLYLDDLTNEIDEVNAWFSPYLCYCPYLAGPENSQKQDERNCIKVFEGLDKLEGILANQHLQGRNYIVGEDITEVDLKAYTVIVRFDNFFAQRFKLTLGTIRHDFPNINQWLKHMHWEIRRSQKNHGLLTN